MKKGLMIGLAIVIADQISKILIRSTMILGETKILINGLLYFEYHENTGMSFGINFPGDQIVFAIVTVLAIGMFVYMLKFSDYHNKKVYTYGIILLLAGALGNFIDRVLFQSVTDFIYIDIFVFDTFIFNIADAALNVGIFLYGFDVIFLESKRKTNEEIDVSSEQ